MKYLFVPYELAVKLKEKKFNENCLAVFISEQLNIVPNIPLRYTSFKNDKSSWVAAPLYQQVVDWLREKHLIHIEISNGLTGYQFHLNIRDQNAAIVQKTKMPFSEYYQTLSKAIELTLEII